MDSAKLNQPRHSAPLGESAIAADGESPGHGVHQLGYRGWSGVLLAGWTRWIVISQVGLQRAWQSQWAKRLLFFAWVPALWFGIAFFVWEQATQYPEWRQMLRPIMRILPPNPVFEEIKQAVSSGNLADSRHTVWAWLLLSFFRYPQAVLMVLVVGLISPPLISQDIRSRAFLIYFSRPLIRIEYLLGKLGCLWACLALISVIPAVILYLIGVILSPSVSVVYSTWDLPLRIIGASVVLILPTSALALCLSSMTQESRYAGFAWFAVWILGWFTYGAVSSAEAINVQQTSLQNREPFGEGRIFELRESAWTHLSLYHTLGRVQSWVFGFAEWNEVLLSIIILTGVTLVSLTVTYYRISAPMRV